jgi:hypothetical protein
MAVNYNVKIYNYGATSIFACPAGERIGNKYLYYLIIREIRRNFTNFHGIADSDV